MPFYISLQLKREINLWGLNFTNWPSVAAVVGAPFARYHDLYDKDGAGSGRDRASKNRFLIRPPRKKFNCEPLLWRYIRLDQWRGVLTLPLWEYRCNFSHSDSKCILNPLISLCVLTIYQNLCGMANFPWKELWMLPPVPLYLRVTMNVEIFISIVRNVTSVSKSKVTSL